MKQMELSEENSSRKNSQDQIKGKLIYFHIKMHIDNEN